MGRSKIVVSWCSRCHKTACDCAACPECKEPDALVWDEVDVGVGVMTGPAACIHCGWSEDSGLDGSEEFIPE